MRKVIAYIASHFRKDKIWLRRTRPDQRTYQARSCAALALLCISNGPATCPDSWSGRQWCGVDSKGTLWLDHGGTPPYAAHYALLHVRLPCKATHSWSAASSCAEARVGSQVVLAVDDSRSMREGGCGTFALEAVTLLARALARLEVCMHGPPRTHALLERPVCSC